MHPAFLDNMSWEMAEVYGAITDQILINLARHFPFYVAGDDLPTSAFAYQAQMLAQMGQVNAETVQIIRNGLADADPALVNCLEQSIMDAVKTSEPELVQAVKKGIFAPPAAPVLSPNQYRAFELYYKQAADKLNMVNTVMLESTQSAYRQAVSDVVSQIEVADMVNRTQIAIDAAAGETITGVSSWNQALRHACDKMNNGGIVGFIDHAGHRWSAEAYVAMDVRTTMFNTGRAAVWETNQTFGNDLYIVSYHNGARPLCYPWQNKVISSMDAARTVVDLDGNEIEVIAQSATSYGEAAGLFGINCKHYPSPFIPGVSLADGKPQDKEDNDRVYEQSQEQRRLERKLREEKRDYMTAKAQGRPQEELDALQQKCRETSGDIDEFCKKTGRARHRDREGVYTKREFPDSQKYDVADFERKQKEMIDGWFKNNGSQQNYEFDQMKSNVPIVPKPKQKEALDASVVTTRPANEQSILTQFKRFDTTKRTEAEMLAQVNPNYSTGEMRWRNNCQRTVVAQEMVYRGYDVTAMPYVKGDPISSSGIAAWDVPKFFWTDPDVKSIGLRSQFVDTVKDAFDGWGDGSRAIVRLKWQKQYGGNGHFIFARRVNGQIIFEDPQSGLVVDIAEKLKKTTTGRNQMWVMRVDNRKVSNNIVYAIKNRE